MKKSKKLTPRDETIRELRKTFAETSFAQLLDMVLEGTCIADLAFDDESEKLEGKLNASIERIDTLCGRDDVPTDVAKKIKAEARTLEEITVEMRGHAIDAMFDTVVEFFLKHSSLNLASLLTTPRRRVEVRHG